MSGDFHPQKDHAIPGLFSGLVNLIYSQTILLQIPGHLDGWLVK